MENKETLTLAKLAIHLVNVEAWRAYLIRCVANLSEQTVKGPSTASFISEMLQLISIVETHHAKATELLLSAGGIDVITPQSEAYQ